MVEIINRSPHFSVVKEIVCRSCGVTLSYVPNDVCERIETDYTGSRDRVRYINCPNCGKSVTI